MKNEDDLQYDKDEAEAIELVDNIIDIVDGKPHMVYLMLNALAFRFLHVIYPNQKDAMTKYMEFLKIVEFKEK